MTTNQMMTVQIGIFGTLEIGHLTKMGNVSKVIEMGNNNRLKKFLSPIEEIFRKQELWEFVIARDTQLIEDSKSGKFPDLKNIDSTDVYQSDYSRLKEFINPNGSIRYGELIKEFPHLIVSKRGKNGGTWAELYILLKIASMLDKDLEVRIYQVFIQEQILNWRDLGGDNYKELNALIDTLEDRKGKKNDRIYKSIAMIFRKKLDIIDTKGYNEKEHDSIIQETRAKWLEKLASAIELDLIKTLPQLKKTIQKLK